MKLYLIFLLMATATVFSPAPGVVMTLTNALGCGFRGIHCMYALFAKRARRWLTSERGGRTVNKAAAATFVFFGAALAPARR